MSLPAKHFYEFGPFRLDRVERSLLRASEPVPLTPKSFELLLALVEHHGHVVEKQALIQAVWPDTFVEETNLTKNIFVLRQALGETGDDGEKYIETIPKRGYRFVARVNECAGKDARVTAQTQLELGLVREKGTETSVADGNAEATIVFQPDVQLANGAARSDRRIQLARTEAARQVRWSKWSMKVGLAVGAVAVLAVVGYLLLRPGAKESRAPLRSATFARLTEQSGEELFPSLSPDGKSFVYASRAAGNWDVYLQRVGGHNPRNLTQAVSADDSHPAFSADGEQIAFRSEREGGGIFVMGATGESVRRLTDFGYHPAWSPDGQEILCTTESIHDPSARFIPSQLWSVKVATGERWLVTPGDAAQAQWSPQGVRIAYWGKHKGGRRDIWTIAASGGEPAPVTDDEALDWNPVWSPDGRYLYFVSDRGGSMNLWRVSIEERSGKVLGAPEPVTIPSTYSQHLSFSRDGRRVAYVQATNRVNIQRIGFDPEQEKIVGSPVWITQGSRSTTNPHLSPDGEWLVIGSQGEKQEDLFVIKKDGTELRQLTDDPYIDRGARWSPVGQQIAFRSDRSGKYEIWSVNADGSGLKQLTYNSANAFPPVWSPDGQRLTYTASRGASFIMEIGKPWQEQTPQALPPLSDPQARFAVASWSPDGRRLAGWRTMRLETAGMFAGITLYSLESKRYEQLTDFGGSPVWLSDSRRLLFLHQGQLYLLNSRSRKAHQLFSALPHGIGWLTRSRDDGLIYVGLRVAEADIWLITLE